MLAPKFNLDLRDFRSAMRRYVRETGKEASQSITDKAFFIARRATWTTEKKDKGEIEKELGAVASTVRQITRGKNAGKWRSKGYILDKSSLAEKLVRARLYNKGEKQPEKAEVQAMASRLIRRRRGTSGFIASGWAAAARALAPFARKGGSKTESPGTKPKVSRTVGGATPARSGKSPQAVLFNQAVSDYATVKGESLVRVAGEGLRAAIAEEVRSIADYLAQRLARVR